MSRQHEIELELFVHDETNEAWRVSSEGNIQDAVWIPKSQCDDAGEAETGKACEFLIPEWLANEKGLI